MCKQDALSNEVVHNFVHNVILQPQARQAMEQAMLNQARPDAAECIARTITAP